MSPGRLSGTFRVKPFVVTQRNALKQASFSASVVFAVEHQRKINSNLLVVAVFPQL